MAQVVLLDGPSLYERHYCLICDRLLVSGHASWCRGDGRVDWNEMRKAVRTRDGYRCRYCEKADGEMQVDHVRPKSQGGQDRLSNLVAACGFCNRSKGARIFVWLRRWEAERARYEAACEERIIDQLDIAAASYG